MHSVWKSALAMKNDVIALRRRIHQSPELSFEEAKTAQLVQQELDRIGVSWTAVGPHGVVATIRGQSDAQAVMLRADMDALPIAEENQHLDYCSQVPGVMHACGHDGHVAMLLGAAAVLQQHQGELAGDVKLCFQQAEERGGGTRDIIDHLSAFPVKSAFAIHLWSELEAGKICTRQGPRMAACDNFEVLLEGVGCHGANPHRGVDPIAAASALVQAASMVVTREIDPTHATALTFGKLQSGHAGNVIPHEAVLAGSIRTTDELDAAYLREALHRLAGGIAATYRVKATVRIQRGGGALINEEQTSALATRCVKEMFGNSASQDFPALMVSENFGDFLEHYPGLMALVGAQNAQKQARYPHHHPKFNIDEDVLPQGVALYAQFALASLAASE